MIMGQATLSDAHNRGIRLIYFRANRSLSGTHVFCCAVPMCATVLCPSLLLCCPHVRYYSITRWYSPALCTDGTAQPCVHRWYSPALCTGGTAQPCVHRWYSPALCTRYVADHRFKCTLYGKTHKLAMAMHRPHKEHAHATGPTRSTHAMRRTTHTMQRSTHTLRTTHVMQTKNIMWMPHGLHLRHRHRRHQAHHTYVTGTTGTTHTTHTLVSGYIRAYG